MGANFETMTLSDMDRAGVESRFAAAQDQDRYENGHSYSGGFGMATGLSFTDEVFTNSDAASEWLDESCQKWGPAIAVMFSNGDDGKRWMIGAICAS